jgi:HEAT repeat protein
MEAQGMLRTWGLIAVLLVGFGQDLLASPEQQRQWLVELHSSDPAVQVEAIRGLAATGDARYQVVLLSLGRRAKGDVQTEAVAGLARHPTLPAALFLHSLVLDDKLDAGLRLTAVRSLAAQGISAAGDLLLDACLALAPTDPVASDVEALMEQHYPDRALLLQAMRTGQPDRIAAKPDDPFLAEVLVLATSTATPSLRRQAIEALAKVGDLRALPVLKEALFSPFPDIQDAARNALQRFPGKDAAWPLAACVAAESLPLGTRLGCVRALAERDDKTAAENLLELSWVVGPLWDHDEGLRSSVNGLIRRELPRRHDGLRGDTAEDPVQADIELLIDLSQTISPRRTRQALQRAGSWPRSVVPALVTWVAVPDMTHLAYSALSSRSDDEGRTALLGLATRSSLPSPVRRQAVHTLAAQRTPEAGEALVLLGREATDPETSKWAIDNLAEFYPDLAVTSGLVTRKKDRSGLIPMAVAGGIHGGIGMTLFSEAVTPDEADMPILPFLGGAILGAGIPILLTLNDEVTTSQSVWVFSGGIWGLANVAALGVALSDGGGIGQWGYGASFGAQLAGLTGAWLTRKGPGSDWGDVGYTNLSWTLGSLAGLGVAFQQEHYSSRWMGGAVFTGGMTGLVAGGLLGRNLEFSGRDAFHTVTLSAMGGWAGGVGIPAAFGYHSNARAGGALIGTALGFAVGSALTPYTDVPVGMALTELAGFGVGNVMGLGLGMVLPDVGDRGRDGLMVGLGAATLALAAATWDKTFYSAGDLTLMAAGTSWGVYQGLAVAGLAGTSSSEVKTGAALLSSSSFLVGTAALSQMVDRTPSQVLGATGMGTTGALFGLGLGLTLPDLSDQGLWGLSFGAGWATLVPSLVLADRMTLTSGDASLLALGSSWGFYQGWGIRDAAGGTSERSLIGATMLGATTGLLSTVVASQFLDPTPRDVGRAATGGFVGSIIGYGLGETIPQLNRTGVMSTMLTAGWAGLMVKGLWIPPGDFGAGDYTAIALGGGWGAFQGWLLGRAAQFEGAQADGAIVLGLGLGLVGGELFARAKDLEATQVLLTELSSYAGSGIGAGITMMAGSTNTTVNALTTALSGWAAKAGAGWLAPRLEFRADDTIEYLTLQGWGMWHGAALAMAFDAKEDTLEGAMLLGAGLGFAVPLVVNQFVDYTAYEDLLIAGCGVWGAWMGSWLPYAVGSDSKKILLWSTLLTDTGLVLGGLLLSPVIDMSRRRLGWIHVSGVAGLGLGSSMTAIFSSRGQSVAMGSVVGSAVGLVTGLFLTSGVRDREARPSLEEKKRSASRERQPEKRLSTDGFPLILPTVFPVPPPVGTDGPATLVYGVEGRF